MANLLELPQPLPEQETFEPLLLDNGVLIERIVSTGQASPPARGTARRQGLTLPAFAASGATSSTRPST
ncbi:hypothetical protein ATI61_1129 [Archangium gephyra]|uniref:Uncharacterized protein n=1 Tax=Archangium gephyra TaxID=48 RepID=A0ABX9JRR6_9BACT|nr:hypothetical protein ATI61_1129 [Archangium gephyra]